MFQLVNLSKYNSEENLLWSRQNTLGVIEMTKDHACSGSELLLVVHESPVPGKPLEVFLVNESEFVAILIQITAILMSILSIWSLSHIFLCSYEAKNSRNSFCFFLSCHLIEVNGSHHQSDFD